MSKQTHKLNTKDPHQHPQHHQQQQLVNTALCARVVIFHEVYHDVKTQVSSGEIDV